ncbi:MAG: iron-containing redox enzyme family protein [Candidatus Obscuribacterales bacterium]
MRIRTNYVLDLARIKLEEERPTDGDFFTSLRDGSMTLEEFRLTQEQFYHAVNYYSQPIAALFSRLNDPALRMKLLLNLLDEHGNIDLERCHTMTFKAFLEGIQACTDAPEGPEAKAFNAALTGICTHEKEEFAMAALGMIELCFTEISQAIAEGVIERGWMKEEDLAHYSLHAHLDSEHATTLFELAMSMDNASDRAITDGLAFGQFLLLRLYEDLLCRSRKAAHMEDRQPELVA